MAPIGRRRNLGRRERPVSLPVRPDRDAAVDEDRVSRGRRQRRRVRRRNPRRRFRRRRRPLQSLGQASPQRKQSSKIELLCSFRHLESLELTFSLGS